MGAGHGALALKLPSVTGQILAGILIGPAVLGVVDHESANRLQPVIDFALALMAVDAGSHLSLRRLRPAKRRLLLLVLFEVTLTPALVFGLATALGRTPWYVSALLATIAISTAPATVLALVKETRSKGVFVKTLMAGVALNNLFCIILFDIAHTLAEMTVLGNADTAPLVLAPFEQLGKSAVLACVLGGGLVFVTRNTVRQSRLTATSMMALLALIGLAKELDASVLLTSLFLGVFLENVTPDKDEVGAAVFANFEYAIYAVFFTIAGTELRFEYLGVAGLVAVAMLAGRATGKVGAGFFAMRLAGATERIQRYLGIALLPQAGLAVGLMLLVTENPVFDATAPIRAARDTFLAAVLAVVLANELVGPVLTKYALVRSGDYQKDRARVLDFLPEEHIHCGMKATSLEDATRQLIRLLAASERIADADALLEKIVAGEQDFSSCVGRGLAMPHLGIDEGREIVGVMGIFPEGFEADTPDGAPIRCVVLFLWPDGKQDHQLSVLRSLARAIGREEAVREQLYHASSPAHAYEVLHLHERSAVFNKYLETGDEAA